MSLIVDEWDTDTDTDYETVRVTFLKIISKQNVYFNVEILVC